MNIDFFNNLETYGFTVSDKVFDTHQMQQLNQLADDIPPFVGMDKNKGWMDPDGAKDKTNDWAYYWSVTPSDHFYINHTILPHLSRICDSVLGVSWGWQLTNRYIMSNYKHDYPVYPHFDAPYIWPQKPEVQMAKYLPPGVLSVTFMIPLVDFTKINGATGFVPGTHKYLYDTADWDNSKKHLQTFFNDNVVQPSVPLGSFSCFYGNCMHSVMPNTIDSVRRGIIFRAIRQDALDDMNKLGLG